MSRTETYLNHTCNFRNKRFVLEDGIWTLRYMADKVYFTKVYDECFTSKGVSIGMKELDSSTTVERNQEMVVDDPHSYCIIQINFDFHSIPNANGNTIDELSHLTNILNNSFDTYFGMCQFDGYRGDYFMYGTDEETKRKTEVCTTGHSRLIYQKVVSVPTIQEYKKNFDKAMKKYTTKWQQRQLRLLYWHNARFLTKSKKYLELSN